jgi:hypothetical protein
MSAGYVAVCPKECGRTRVEGRVQDGAVNCKLECSRGP